MRPSVSLCGTAGLCHPGESPRVTDWMTTEEKLIFILSELPQCRALERQKWLLHVAPRIISRHLLTIAGTKTLQTAEWSLTLLFHYHMAPVQSHSRRRAVRRGRALFTIYSTGGCAQWEAIMGDSLCVITSLCFVKVQKSVGVYHVAPFGAITRGEGASHNKERPFYRGEPGWHWDTGSGIICCIRCGSESCHHGFAVKGVTPIFYKY